MRLKIGVIATAAMVFIAAGCGGSAGGHRAGAMGAAAVAPGSAAAYVAVDSNLDSAAWTKAKALLDHFPGKNKFIAHLRSSLQQEGLDWETDVKPALGSEIDLVPGQIRTTFNLHDDVWVSRGGTLVDRWPITARGSSQ